MYRLWILGLGDAGCGSQQLFFWLGKDTRGLGTGWLQAREHGTVVSVQCSFPVEGTHFMDLLVYREMWAKVSALSLDHQLCGKVSGEWLCLSSDTMKKVLFLYSLSAWNFEKPSSEDELNSKVITTETGWADSSLRKYLMSQGKVLNLTW